MRLRMRHLAEVNPPTPEFERLSSESTMTFVPLDAVWADSRLDLGRSRVKNEVSVGYTRFRDGDVIVPKVTPTFQAARSTVVANLVNGVGAGSTELHVLRARPGVDARFLQYVVRSQPFLTEGVAAFQGVAGLQRVTDDFIRNFPVVLFSLEEQRRIADFLDAETLRLDRLLNLRSLQTSLLLQRERAAINSIFEDHSWPSTRIKLLLASRPRYGVLVPEFVDEGVPFIRVNDLLDLEGRRPDLVQIPHHLSRQYARTIVEPGDVLVSVVGTLGRSAVASEALVGSNVARAIASLRPRESVDGRLLSAWFLTSAFAEQALLATASDTAQPTLGMEDLAGFSIRWPCNRSDQARAVERAATLLSTASQAQEMFARQRALLLERRQALITAAVTGQIDVTTARGVGVP